MSCEWNQCLHKETRKVIPQVRRRPLQTRRGPPGPHHLGPSESLPPEVRENPALRPPVRGPPVTAAQRPCRAQPASPTHTSPGKCPGSHAQEPALSRSHCPLPTAHARRLHPAAGFQRSAGPGGRRGGRTALALVRRSRRPPARVALSVRERPSPQSGHRPTPTGTTEAVSQPWTPCRRERGWGPCPRSRTIPAGQVPVPAPGRDTA